VCQGVFCIRQLPQPAVAIDASFHAAALLTDWAPVLRPVVAMLLMGVQMNSMVLLVC
jgi:hypothetical protein